MPNRPIFRGKTVLLAARARLAVQARVSSLHSVEAIEAGPAVEAVVTRAAVDVVVALPGGLSGALSQEAMREILGGRCRRSSSRT